MVEMLDSIALMEERSISKTRTVLMDRRFLVIATAIVAASVSGFLVKEAMSRDDTIRPLIIVEHPPISPQHEILVGGDEVSIK